MNSKQANILIILLLIANAFLGVIAFRAEKSSPRSLVYDYKEITVNSIDEDYSKHNTWIEEGWEPIFLLKTDGVDERYLMRRPKH
ncbi:hypothetical protein [Akkermansia massiliensis]|uniref:Uncharacterized protein n=1 Tax=Akkermansia massiliensis TaxID=2927224 RepID=A0AAE6T863_9BACT|nr:hypothetical protein [Akkermansia massiliensis]QHV62028.1 hypothetical protein DMI76_00930 [Akkermansia massiliensis]QHV74395.1 hypothetical protein DMI75_00930 [Akkermansia massiliensis]